MEQSLTLECKCHGVSGSCSVRTCWRGLGSSGPSVAGTRLLRRYATAAEVKPRSGGRLPPLYHHDNLLYTTKSPDYCLPDKKRGSLGTIGRWVFRTTPFVSYSYSNSKRKGTEPKTSIKCGPPFFWPLVRKNFLSRPSSYCFLHPYFSFSFCFLSF